MRPLFIANRNGPVLTSRLEFDAYRGIYTLASGTPCGHLNHLAKVGGNALSEMASYKETTQNKSLHNYCKLDIAVRRAKE